MNSLAHKTQFEELLLNYQPSPEVSYILNKLSIVILTAPTASGRNTIINALIDTGGYQPLVSDTTREPRVNDGVLEKSGREYWFRSEEEFLTGLKNNEFLEAAIIHDQQVSGISLRELKKLSTSDKIAINEIEVVGADHLHALNPNTKFIFVLPPDFMIWMERLEKRGKMTTEELHRRLKSAELELQIALTRDYFSLVVNNNLIQAVHDVDLLARGKKQSDSQKANARIVASELLESVTKYLNKL